MKKFIVLLLLFAVMYACNTSSFKNDLTHQVGPIGDNEFLVPTQQILDPAGEAVEFNGRPVDLILSPDEKYAYVKDNRGVVAIETSTWHITQELKFPQSGGSMHGMAINHDGTKLYATSAHNQLFIASIHENGKLRWDDTIELAGPNGTGAAHPCGIALSPDERYAYVCLSRNNSLGVVNLQTNQIESEIPTGIAPFDIEISQDGRYAYVSNWGGRYPRENELTADSSGTDVVVDERGVASTGSLSKIDLVSQKEIIQIEVGLHPSEIVLTQDESQLFVANANSDTISRINTKTMDVVESMNIRPNDELPFGSAPNALALSTNGKTLYVANGGNNAVGVIDVTSNPAILKGFIPTGWYPGAVRCTDDSLYIANVKGIGSRHKPENQDSIGYSVYWYLGTVNKVETPSSSQLNAYTNQVSNNSRVPKMLRAYERQRLSKKPVPVPENLGDPSVFEHVVYIIKENRTYDQVFGDLPQGNGDPELCIYGREVTPNHHALAEQFVLLDNFYCNGVNSADGHAWSTEGNVTDYLEKSFGGFTRSYTWGDDALSYSSSGFIWDNVLLHGLSFRNYGEMDYAETIPSDLSFKEIYQAYQEEGERPAFIQNIGIDRLKKYSSPDFYGWSLKIPDTIRADIFLEELEECEKRNEWYDFTLIFIGNDHTSGTSPGYPTPRAQVADNDLALGKIVQGISESQFWPKTCIFIIEDDPQNGFDHVDGHRSLCLIASPYTKRGEVIHTFYNQTSVLHTMQRILGVPPMNQMDSSTEVMSDCFTNDPVFASYQYLPNQIPLDEMNPQLSQLEGDRLKWAQKSLEQPLTELDEADEDTFNQILWHDAKGYDTPYPSHLAGAHGTGLKDFDLILTGDDD